MNLSARIKSAKNKPNYVLNVNINIPIRPSNLQSYRPVSGQFTFSPSQRNKKLKLQVPSARTTNQCESRKISYLGQTQNTISYRNNNNRKKTTKSAFPSQQISQILNNNKKSRDQFRSQAVSPNSKKGSKRSKILSSHQLTKDKQFVNDLIDMSEDNIIGYTHQSSQLTKGNRNINSNLDIKGYDKIVNEKDKIDIKNAVFKVQTPLLQEQRGLISGIRQFQKTAQLKKQHLNYEYLKEKVLVLASVKKIQRAWRNYKTKKLIKSYSNNISLKFTGKMKNQFHSNQQPQQFKILTVRSCGYNSKGNDLRRKGKKNLSQLFPKDQDFIQQQYTLENEQGEARPFKKKLAYQQSDRKSKQNSSKSAVAKFQMQQIKKWEQLIKHIRQGKKVQQVLQASFKRKQQLEKSLSNNLKQLGSLESSQMSQVSVKSQQSNKIAKSKQKVEQDPIYIQKNDVIVSCQQASVSSSQNSLQQKQKLYNTQSPNILTKQRKLKPLNISNIDKNKKAQQHQQSYQSYQQQQQQQQQLQQQGATTKRRRKKLQYFQNEIRKIDNQYSQSNLSVSYNSQSQQLNSSPECIKINSFISNNNKQKQLQQNEKLKKKIQALNKIQLFSSSNNTNQHKQSDNQTEYLYTKLQKNKQIQQYEHHNNNNNKQQLQLKQHKQNQYLQFFPISINSTFHNRQKQFEILDNDDRLQTFRNKNYMEKNYNLYEDMQNDRLKQLKKMKLSNSQKQSLASKIQQELLYDLFLQFSQQNGVISKMEKLYEKIKEKKQSQQAEKPQGICTNLQSIKDYLQNFVAFVFGIFQYYIEQQPMRLIQGFNEPRGPSGSSLLKALRSNDYIADISVKKLVISQLLFNKHWQYASQQIYFDAKFPNDPIKQQQRVKYLKQITKTYFRAIFDGFNQCLQSYRMYGYSSKPFPWQPNIRKKVGSLNLQQIRPLIRLGYRKLSQIAVIYCGLLFQDKKHNMSHKMVQQIQKQRLDTLVQIQLQDEQYKWQTNRLQKSEIMYKLSQAINQILIIELCKQIHKIYLQR